MKSIEYILNYLKENLSKERFNHTVGVSETAKALAKKWGADEHSAYVAGLVHDCAKEISPQLAIKMLEDRGYIADSVERRALGLLHAPLGAYLAQEYFEIENKEILDSVRFHTTGRVGMTLLDKIIYVADFIEPGRKYKESDIVRQIAETNLDAAVLKEADIVIKFTIEKGRQLHPDTIIARNSYLNIINEVKENET